MINGKAIALRNEKRELKILPSIVVMIVCAVLGVLAKHIINPAANVVTDMLHVPGGIATAFSLMFLVVATGITAKKGSATIMAAAQGMTALAIGMVGSMGPLIPLAYIVPGIAIDLVFLIPDMGIFDKRFKAFTANIAGSVAAALFANILVFHLPGMALSVYLLVAAVSGAIFGFVAGAVIKATDKI